MIFKYIEDIKLLIVLFKFLLLDMFQQHILLASHFHLDNMCLWGIHLPPPCVLQMGWTCPPQTHSNSLDHIALQGMSGSLGCSTNHLQSTMLIDSTDYKHFATADSKNSHKVLKKYVLMCTKTFSYPNTPNLQRKCNKTGLPRIYSFLRLVFS